MSKPTLYSYWRSSCSWRVRIGKIYTALVKANKLYLKTFLTALELKKIEYEYQPVHLVKDGGEQHKHEYKMINPMEQVPALVMDDVTITQSLPIIEFLEETFKGSPKILPDDTFSRAKVREISEVINSGTQPIQNLSVMNKHSSEQAARVEWSRFWIEKGLRSVEQFLTKSSGKFCVGDQVTMADCCLVPQVYNANRFKVDMEQFPNINKVIGNLEKMDAFIAAHPDNQPDKQ